MFQYLSTIVEYSETLPIGLYAHCTRWRDEEDLDRAIPEIGVEGRRGRWYGTGDQSGFEGP